MILVVCPNLAVDVTLEVDRLVPGSVHRASGSRRQAGGKGVNTARALRALGEEAIVLGFASSQNGETIVRGLEEEGLAHEIVPIAGESRTCTILLARDGTATVVNETGPTIAPEEASALWRAFQAHAREEKTIAVALMGSLPPGVEVDFYARMVATCRDENRWCLVDTSGTPLSEALGARPDVVKPNRDEAEALLGTKLEHDEDRRRALEALCARGATTALITEGARGVYFASRARYGLARAETSDLSLGNPTGAGDSLAAGLIAGYARGYDLEATLRLGVAAATASLAEGYGRIRARDIRLEAVTIEQAEPK